MIASSVRNKAYASNVIPDTQRLIKKVFAVNAKMAGHFKVENAHVRTLSTLLTTTNAKHAIK